MGDRHDSRIDSEHLRYNLGMINNVSLRESSTASTLPCEPNRHIGTCFTNATNYKTITFGTRFLFSTENAVHYLHPVIAKHPIYLSALIYHASPGCAQHIAFTSTADT